MARGDEMEEEELEVSEGGGSKKKLIIIIAAAVLVLAIGGGAAYYFLYYNNKEPAAEEGADKKVEKKVVIPVIYGLEPFIVNISDGKDTRYLKIKLEFETTATKETVKAEFDPYLAPIRDSILILLTSKTLQDVQDIQGKNRLREEIMAAANKILPPGKITRLFFTDFVVQ